MIVVGEVAGVDLAWFERRPLFGRRGGRDPHPAAGVASSAGALPRRRRRAVEVPVIEIADPADGGAALRGRGRGASATYDWVVAHLAQRRRSAARRRRCGRWRRPLVRRLPRSPPSGRAPPRRWPPGGSCRPRARASSSPSRSSTRSPPPPVAGGRVLLARAEVARDVLPDGLRDARAGTSTSSTPTAPWPAPLTDEQRDGRGGADVVTFTSSSTVDALPRAPSVPTPCRPSSPASARSPPPRPASTGSTVDVEAEVHTDRRPRRRARRAGQPPVNALDAVVFDFDGLILDTEWADLRDRPRGVRRATGTTLDGRGVGDDRRASTTTPTTAGGRGSAPPTDVERLRAGRLRRAPTQAQDRSSRDELPPLPGVVELVDGARPRPAPDRHRLVLVAAGGSTATSAGSGSRPLRRGRRRRPRRWRRQARARRLPPRLRRPRCRPGRAGRDRGLRPRRRRGEGRRDGGGRGAQPHHRLQRLRAGRPRRRARARSTSRRPVLEPSRRGRPRRPGSLIPMALPPAPAAPAAPHPGAAPPGRRDPRLGRRPRRAAVRARGHRRAAAHRQPARRRAAHPRVAPQGGRRAGRRSASRRVILFGVPAAKDAEGSRRVGPRRHRAAGARATCAPRSGDELVLIADLCVDEYTDHGHCGIVGPDGEVDNDATLEPLRAGRGRAGRRRRRHHRAERDDGRAGRRHPRRARRRRPRPSTAILAYAAKYASALVRPVPRRGRRHHRRRRRPQGLPAGPGATLARRSRRSAPTSTRAPT